MVLRHHNEAESLNAVQKMDWEWKLGEFPGNKAMVDVLTIIFLYKNYYISLQFFKTGISKGQYLNST